MKKNSLIIIFIVIVSSCQCNKKKEYYSDGSIKIEKIYCKNNEHIKTIEHYRNGLVSSITFENVKGNLDGKCSYFDKNGNIESSVVYKDGISDGIAKWFYPNGKIMEEVYIINKERVGPHIYYDLSGNIVRKNFYILINNKSFFNGYLVYNKFGNIIPDSSMYVFLKTDKDTVNINDTITYWFNQYLSKGIQVKAIIGNIDKNFNIVDSTTIKYVNPNLKNKFSPTKVGNDTIRIIYELKKETANNTIDKIYKGRILLEKILNVRE